MSTILRFSDKSEGTAKFSSFVFCAVNLCDQQLLSFLPGLPAETTIDRFVTVGAYSLLRSCTIEPECIIGQHSILMEGSLVETHSILEAGSVVPPGRRIPTGELWAGNPARFVRTQEMHDGHEDHNVRAQTRSYVWISVVR